MSNRRNPTAYLAIINNNPNGTAVLELDNWITQIDGALNHPDIHATMKSALTKFKPTLQTCKDDIAAGRQNAFWNTQKAKAQAAKDEEDAEDY